MKKRKHHTNFNSTRLDLIDQNESQNDHVSTEGRMTQDMSALHLQGKYNLLKEVMLPKLARVR